MLSTDEVEQKFIRYQALGLAIKQNRRVVVLVDEIDKAPRDFPNDILNVLEDMYFEVPEIGKLYRADSAARPLVIFTSNSEKNLPDAFLRRCVFFHIPFPKEEELVKIVGLKLDSEYFTKNDISSVIIPHFLRIRQEMTAKKPGTAELIYWIWILKSLGVDVNLIRKAHVNTTPLTPDEFQRLSSSYSVLAKTDEDFKRIQALFVVGVNG